MGPPEDSLASHCLCSGLAASGRILDFPGHMSPKPSVGSLAVWEVHPHHLAVGKTPLSPVGSLDSYPVILTGTWIMWSTSRVSLHLSHTSMPCSPVETTLLQRWTSSTS